MVIIKALVELTCSSLFISIITLVAFLKLLFINNCFIQEEDHKSSNHAWRWCWWPWQIRQDTGQICRISRSGHAIRSVSGGKMIFCSVLGLGLFFLLLFIPNYIYFVNPVLRCDIFFSFKSVNSILTAMAAQGDSQSDMTPRRLCRRVIAAGCESPRAYRNNSMPRILKIYLLYTEHDRNIQNKRHV